MEHRLALRTSVIEQSIALDTSSWGTQGSLGSEPQHITINMRQTPPSHQHHEIRLSNLWHSIDEKTREIGRSGIPMRYSTFELVLNSYLACAVSSSSFPKDQDHAILDQQCMRRYRILYAYW